MHAKPAPRKRSMSHLLLETLEDRTVPSTLQVDPSGLIYPGAFATIQSAVNAAAAGDTVLVARGTYSENVTVNKPLQLLGAQHGVDARSGRADLSQESVVKGFILLQATGDIVDGFTENTASGNIQTTTSGSGYQILNNVIGNAGNNAIYVNTNGALTTTISGNSISGGLVAGIEVDGLNPSPTPTNSIPQNVIVSQNRLRNNVAGVSLDHGAAGVQILFNEVSYSSATGISATSSINATISANIVAHNGSDGIELLSSDGAQISRNLVTQNGTNATFVAGGLGNGILVGFSDGVAVRMNLVANNGRAGILLMGATNVSVNHNASLANAGNGFELQGVITGSIVGNVARSNVQNGITVDATSSGNMLVNNVFLNNGVGSNGQYVDAADHSIGSGTAGTADIWVHDLFSTYFDANGVPL